VDVPPEIIIARGKQFQHRRRVGLAIAALCALALAVPLANRLVRPDGGNDDPADLALALSGTPEYAAHPPDGDPVVVDDSVAGWRSLAWASVDGQICAGTVGVSGHARGSVGLTCTTVADDPQFPAGAAPVYLPAFQALPTPNDNDDKVLVIGLARSDVGSVGITFRGHKVNATVHEVVRGPRPELMAYAAWLPLDGATSYGTRDISALTAWDASGRLLGETHPS
jgi:hypothetical protein